MISFIIPAKNERNYVGGCLQSIFNQSFKEPFEVIVVDNGSTDGMSEYIKKSFPEVTVLNEPIQGTNLSRQKGFLHSKGEVLIFLDADVRLPRSWIEKVFKKFDNKLIAISGYYHFYDFPLYLKIANLFFIYLISTPWQFFFHNILRGPSFMIGGNMIIRRNALQAIGGFDVSYKFHGDDFDTSIRLGKIGKILFTPSVWVYSSARRFNVFGVFRTLFLYLGPHYLYTIFTKKPHKSGTTYKEVR